MDWGERGRAVVGGVRWLAVASVPFVLVVLAARSQGMDPTRVTRDLAATCHAHPLDGVLSSLGVLGWIATAAICVGSGLLTWRVVPRGARFLVAAGALSLLLGLDDLLQFHEAIARTLLGVQELVVYEVIGAATLLFLWCFRRPILDGAPGWLLCALCLLAGSVAVDMVSEHWNFGEGTLQMLLEDGLKWLGILCWLRFFAVQAASVLRVAGLDRAQSGPSIWGPATVRDAGITA